ncbi:hypothetical protein FOZ63_007325, partial [Perkinsus olseni]
LTENLTRSLNLSLRTQGRIVHAQSAQRNHYRGPQVVYDVTTRGARVNEGKKAVFDVTVDKLKSLARSKRGADSSRRVHEDRCRDGRRVFEDSSLRFRQEVLRDQQYLYRIDKEHGSSEEERFRLKVWHGPVARNASQKLKKDEKSKLEARRRAGEEASQGGRVDGLTT